MASNYTVPEGFADKTNADAPLSFLLKYWGNDQNITEYEAREWQKKFPEYANLIRYSKGYTDPDSGTQIPGQWIIDNAAFEKMKAPEGSGFNNMYDYITAGRARYALPDPTNGGWSNYNMEGTPTWDPLLGWSAQSTNTGFDKFAPLLGATMMAVMGGAGLTQGFTSLPGAATAGSTAGTAAGTAAGTGAGWTLEGAAGSVLSGLGSIGSSIAEGVGSVLGGIGEMGLSGALKLGSLASTAYSLGSKIFGGGDDSGGTTRTTRTGGPGSTISNLISGAGDLITGGGGGMGPLLPALLGMAGNAYYSKKWGDLITDEGMSDKLNPMGPERKFYKGLLADYYRDPLSAIEKMPGYAFAQNAALNALDAKAGMTRRFMGSAYPQWLQDRAGQVAAQYANQYENNLARLAGADIGPGAYAGVVTSAMTNEQQAASNALNSLAIAMGAGRGGTNVNVNTSAGGGPGYTTNSDGIRLSIGDPHAVTGAPDFSFTENSGGTGVVDDFWGTPIGAWDVTGDPDYSFTDQDWG